MAKLVHLTFLYRLHSLPVPNVVTISSSGPRETSHHPRAALSVASLLLSVRTNKPLFALRSSRSDLYSQEIPKE
jgi:hypothetical protein